LSAGARVRITEAECRELVAQVIAAHGLDLFSQDEYPVGAVNAVGTLRDWRTGAAAARKAVAACGLWSTPRR